MDEQAPRGMDFLAIRNMRAGDRPVQGPIRFVGGKLRAADGTGSGY